MPYARTKLELDVLTLANLIEKDCRGLVHSCHKCSGIATALRSLIRGGQRDPIETVYARLCRSLVKDERPWAPMDTPEVENAIL